MTWVDLILLFILAFVLYWIGAKVFIRKHVIYKGKDWDFTPSCALSIESSPLLQMSLAAPSDLPYFLILDTETTTLVASLRASDGSYPPVVCLSWRLLSREGKVIETQSFVLLRDEDVSWDAEEVHGISTEMMLGLGLDPVEIYKKFFAAVRRATVCVAHSADFHRNVILQDLERFQIDSSSLVSKPFLCTMHNGARYLVMKEKWAENVRISLTTLYSLLYLNRTHQEIVYKNKSLRDITLCSFCLVYLQRAEGFELQFLPTIPVSENLTCGDLLSKNENRGIPAEFTFL